MFLTQGQVLNGAFTLLTTLPIVCVILWKILLTRFVRKSFKTDGRHTTGCVKMLKLTFLSSGSMDV